MDAWTMKVLNLYAGIGGNRKLWEDVEVTAVELDPKIAAIYQDFFPDDTMIIGDAHQYLLDHYKEFDFIWSSPPCPTHSRLRRSLAVESGQNEPVFPDMKLYEEIIFIQSHFKGLYCIENVISYYDPLIKPQTINRHYFWANFIIRDVRMHTNNIQYGGVGNWQERLGFDLSSYTGIDKRKILRNCVIPELGSLILDCARGNTQKTLVESINSKRLRISE